MSQPGIGAMLHALGGGSEEDPKKYYGRKIKKVEFADDALNLSFTDGSAIKISDQGQSCCEHRYMRTDDEPQDLKGKVLKSIEAKDATQEGDDSVHEIVFLEVKAGDETVAFSFHNEHNGYYGGFGLSVSETSAPS